MSSQINFLHLTSAKSSPLCFRTYSHKREGRKGGPANCPVTRKRHGTSLQGPYTHELRYPRRVVGRHLYQFNRSGQSDVLSERNVLQNERKAAIERRGNRVFLMARLKHANGQSGHTLPDQPPQSTRSPGWPTSCTCGRANTAQRGVKPFLSVK